MSRGINRVIIVGSLGADPEVGVTAGGVSVVSLSIATNEAWKGKDGQQQERTEWHKVVLFGRQSEVARDYLSKGSSVYVEGKLRYRKYTDKQGNDRHVTEIIGNNMQMLGGKKSPQSSSVAKPAPPLEEDDILWDEPGSHPPDWLDPDKLPF